MASSAAGRLAGLQPGVAPAKPVSQYTLVGTSPPRIDIPANRYRDGRLHPERPRARHAARTGRAAARPGAYGAGSAPRSSRSTRARSRTSPASRSSRAQLPRRGRAAGVRRDPGRRAAEGHVGRRPGRAPGSGDDFGGHAGARQRRQDDLGRRPRRSRGQHGNVDARARLGGARPSAASYGWPTNVHTPDRPAVRGRRRDRAGSERSSTGHAGRLSDAPGRRPRARAARKPGPRHAVAMGGASATARSTSTSRRRRR